MKQFVQRYMSIIVIIVLLVIWQCFGFLNLLPKFILPTPLEIVTAYTRDVALLMQHTQSTMTVAMIGLFFGIVIACILAVIMDSFELVQKAIYPLLIVTQNVPTIALAPILVLWLGYGVLPKVVLIVLTTAFPIVVSVLDGFIQTDRDAIMLFKLMNANKKQVLWHLKIPFALPYFFAGVKVSTSYAFITCVVSEWLGGFEGLGVYMIRAKKLFQYDTMFAIILLVALISICSMKLVTIVEKRMIKWQS